MSWWQLHLDICFTDISNAPGNHSIVTSGLLKFDHHSSFSYHHITHNLWEPKIENYFVQQKSLSPFLSWEVCCFTCTINSFAMELFFLFCHKFICCTLMWFFSPFPFPSEMDMNTILYSSKYEGDFKIWIFLLFTIKLTNTDPRLMS